MLLFFHGISLSILLCNWMLVRADDFNHENANSLRNEREKETKENYLFIKLVWQNVDCMCCLFLLQPVEEEKLVESSWNRRAKP